MVLKLPKKAGQALDLQKDVRETAGISGTPIIGDFTSANHSHAAAGATGGTVNHVNLTNKGTNTHAQVDSHIANTANPHSVILSDVASAGEGIDFPGGNSIAGENASTSNKGIASFDNGDFQVTSGVVTLDADIAKTFDGDSGTATTAIHNIDILGGTGISTVGETNNITITNDGVTSAVAGNGIDVSGATGAVTITAEDSTAGNKGIVIVTGGEGMDVSYTAGNATISGENASTSNKGIASFANADFSVTNGVVDLKSSVVQFLEGDSGQSAGLNNRIFILGGTGITTTGASPTGDDLTIALTNKTSYWSCNGSNFVPLAPDTDAHDYSATTGGLQAGAGQTDVAPVFLPHGAVVTAAIVYSDDTGTWSLIRMTSGSATAATMATAAANTQDTSISNATIDNNTYNYFIAAASAGAIIRSARITYTTDYD